MLLTPIPSCQEDEKAKLEEEEELRSREAKELEEYKKRISLPGKFDYLQTQTGTENRRLVFATSKYMKIII